MTAPSAAASGDTQSLISGFLASARRQPQAPALVVAGESLSYAALLNGAERVASGLNSLASSRFCAVLGVGTKSVFEDILGILLSGRAYVPLNPAFPITRTAYMISASETDTLLVDPVGEKLLPRLLPLLEPGLTIVLAENSEPKIDELTESFPDFRFVADLSGLGEEVGGTADFNESAYLMFTSGSTGKPKGVVVTHANVRSFIDSIVRLYELGPNDRFSQMFDLTFDLSVFDMFICWEVGASLWVVPPKSRMAPAAFIRKSALTVWFSVPAVGAYMNQLKMLRPDNFPSLRFSLFCGEPLPATVALAWQAAAPGSRLDNLYGPTELTIACGYYRWDSSVSPSVCVNGVVPIGGIYSGLVAAIVDDKLQPVPPGQDGELCVSGKQTTPGYWNRPDLTAEKFVAMSWADEAGNRWYRTGDVVRETASGDMVFIGRVDNQVKIRGYRVELGEIEEKLRQFGQTDFAIAVPWPVGVGGAAAGLVACLAGSDVDDDALLAGCRGQLPEYMVPLWTLRLDKMPLNSNGKIDRNALASLVEEASVSR